MIITKKEYLKKISFNPILDEKQINFAAADLKVGTTIYDFEKKKEIYNGGKKIIIKPGEHILIRTLEEIKMSNDLIGIVYPRSSTNRRGLTLDITGIVDAGYEGFLMMPFSNFTKHEIVLEVGERIAQIVFNKLSESDTDIRKSKYHKSGMEEKQDKE